MVYKNVCTNNIIIIYFADLIAKGLDLDNLVVDMFDQTSAEISMDTSNDEHEKPDQLIEGCSHPVDPCENQGETECSVTSLDIVETNAQGSLSQMDVIKTSIRGYLKESTQTTVLENTVKITMLLVQNGITDMGGFMSTFIEEFLSDGSLDINKAKILFAFGVSPSHTDKHGVPFLRRYILSTGSCSVPFQLDIIREMVNKGGDLLKQDEKEETSLYHLFLSSFGNTKMTQDVISFLKKYKIESSVNELYKAFSVCLKKKTIIQNDFYFFLALKADINHVDSQQTEPFIISFLKICRDRDEQPAPALLSAFLNRNDDILFQTDDEGETGLFYLLTNLKFTDCGIVQLGPKSTAIESWTDKQRIMFQTTFVSYCVYMLNTGKNPSQINFFMERNPPLFALDAKNRVLFKYLVQLSKTANDGHKLYNKLIIEGCKQGKQEKLLWNELLKCKHKKIHNLRKEGHLDTLDYLFIAIKTNLGREKKLKISKEQIVKCLFNKHHFDNLFVITHFVKDSNVENLNNWIEEWTNGIPEDFRLFEDVLTQLNEIVYKEGQVCMSDVYSAFIKTNLVLVSKESDLFTMLKHITYKWSSETSFGIDDIKIESFFVCNQDGTFQDFINASRPVFKNFLKKFTCSKNTNLSDFFLGNLISALKKLLIVASSETPPAGTNHLYAWAFDFFALLPSFSLNEEDVVIIKTLLTNNVTDETCAKYFQRFPVAIPDKIVCVNMSKIRTDLLFPHIEKDKNIDFLLIHDTMDKMQEFGLWLKYSSYYTACRPNATKTFTLVLSDRECITRNFWGYLDTEFKAVQKGCTRKNLLMFSRAFSTDLYQMATDDHDPQEDTFEDTVNPKKRSNISGDENTSLQKKLKIVIDLTEETPVVIKKEK